MILRRRGNKTRIAHKIVPLFPDHTTYIELFFGAGGMFFSKPKARTNILNDLDYEVYNLFKVAIDKQADLRKLWTVTPIHSRIWKEWQHEIPEDQVERAVRFLMLSNLGFMGSHSTLRLASGNAKRIVLERLAMTRQLLWDCEFTCADWSEVLRKVPRDVLGRKTTFIYADPPYLDTSSDDYVAGFKEADSISLINTLHLCGAKFAISEFDHPVLLKHAAELGLNITIIGERNNLMNRRTEVLITNYITPTRL